MPTQENNDDRIALLQGTLDILILKTLILGPCHGQGVARSIQRQSEEVLFVDHGSLYLALQRLEDKKLIQAKWGVSENNRLIERHPSPSGMVSRTCPPAPICCQCAS